MSTATSPDAAVISPITGWTRAHWVALADRMLLAVRPYVSPGHARVPLPGPPGGFGTAVDGLEGFARTFLMAGFRLAGESGRDPHDLAGWYARGLSAGTDPGSGERWPRPDEHPQAKVEAASLALILDLTRPWIWDRLPAGVQERVISYLAAVVGDDDYPRCNWVWFRIVVETFLRSVGGPWSADDIESDVAAHESFYRQDGWYSDGDERAYDHYNGWALHLYPILWARMRGGDELAAGRTGTDIQRLERFLRDYLRLIGGDGSPLIQGRSLVYRFAAAAPLWAGAMADVHSVSPGRLRRAASGIVAHFAEHGAPDENGLLTLGWHREWRRMAQSYSGPSSPYWAAKGMLGLALGADHPVWTAVEEPLPVECGDEVWIAHAPGWLVSATQRDGVVRVVNHGTDHAVVGSESGDSPWYTRLGYSTATAPPASPDAWASPVDQSVVLLDADGRATHRAGMRTLRLDVLGTGGGRAAVGASVARAHWVDPAPGQRDHGSGREGANRDAGTVATVSVVRDRWEVRCVRVGELAGAPGAPAAKRLRVGGWPRAGEAVTSVLLPAEGFDEAGAHAEDDAGPLGPHTVTPWVAGPVVPGRWCVAVIGLSGPVGDERPPRVTVDGDVARIEWPDGEAIAVGLASAPARDDENAGRS